MSRTCENILDSILEYKTQNTWSINATKDHITPKLLKNLNTINYKQELYSSAIFKSLWTKEYEYPSGKKDFITASGTFNSMPLPNFEDYNDELDASHIIFKQGVMHTNFGLANIGGYVYHDTGDKYSSVYDYFAKIIEVLENSTTPGLLASLITGGTSVGVFTGFHKKDIKFIAEDIDKDNPSINAGVYIIHIKDGATTNVEESIMGTNDLFVNKWIYIVDYGCKLDLTRKVANANGVIDDVSIIQYPDSEVTINTYDKDNQWRHIDITAYQNTKTIVNGSVLCKNSSSAHNVVVNHKGNNGLSRIKYHSAIYNTNITDFIGSINVDKKAVGTDAIMINKNLLMDKSSKAKSIPKLNINTKEIECSHGCTISNIDEDEIYYLETLGVSRNSARRLIADGHIQI